MLVKPSLIAYVRFCPAVAACRWLLFLHFNICSLTLGWNPASSSEAGGEGKKLAGGAAYPGALLESRPPSVNAVNAAGRTWVYPGLKRALVPSTDELDVSPVGLRDIGHVPPSHRYIFLTAEESAMRFGVLLKKNQRLKALDEGDQEYTRGL